MQVPEINNHPKNEIIELPVEPPAKSPVEFSAEQLTEPFVKPFRRAYLADIAESLAKMKITGERSDTDFMKIIRYFPEDSAFDELKNAWCAAFVYHCCSEAGLSLPIGIHNITNGLKGAASLRLACVAAWYGWGMASGSCRFEKDGYIPIRGDILIYNNIIPKENKPESSTWCDHIGIILSQDGECLTVAEGNTGNKNVSGIVERKRDETVGCYIHIPDDYKYDGWKIDFKTGEIRIREYI